MKRKFMWTACLGLGMLAVTSQPATAQFSGRALGMEQPKRPSHPKYPSPNFPNYPTPNPYRPGPNSGHRPPGPRPDNTANIAIDIGRIIAPLLTPPPNSNPGNRPPRPPYQPPYQPPRPPYQPPYQPQVVYPQQNMTTPIVNTVPSNPLPSNTLPSNTLPDNDLPVEEETPEVPTEQNFALTEIQPLPEGALSLTQAQADAASESLKSQAQEKFQQMDKHIDALNEVMEQEKQLADANLDPADAAKVKAAIDARDPDALREALANAKGGVPGAEYAEMVASKMDTLNQAEKLKDLIDKGAPAGEIAQASQDYLNAGQKALTEASAFDPALTPDAIQKSLEDDFNNLNDIVALKAADEALQASVQGTLNVPGGMMPIPTDPIIAAWVPWLEPGMTYSVGPQMVMLGTGEGGVLTSGFVTPAEAGLPSVTGQRVQNSSDEDLETNIVVLNPDTNTKAVSFQLNGENYTLEPGFEQVMTGTDWTIKFNRGGGFGVAEYSLSNGRYEFEIGGEGWELGKLEQEFTIDNTANAYDFNFVLGDEQLKVAARESTTFTTTALVKLRFDDGHGAEKVRKLENGTYSVALDRENNEIDLFEGEAKPQKQSEMFANNGDLGDNFLDLLNDTPAAGSTYQQSSSYPGPIRNPNPVSAHQVPVGKVVEPPQRFIKTATGRKSASSKSKQKGRQETVKEEFTSPVPEPVFLLE